MSFYIITHKKQNGYICENRHLIPSYISIPQSEGEAVVRKKNMYNENSVAPSAVGYPLMLNIKKQSTTGELNAQIIP